MLRCLNREQFFEFFGNFNSGDLMAEIPEELNNFLEFLKFQSITSLRLAVANAGW